MNETQQFSNAREVSGRECVQVTSRLIHTASCVTNKNRKINLEFNISTESILIGVGTVVVIALVALAFSTGVGEVITALSTLVSAGVSLFAH